MKKITFTILVLSLFSIGFVKAQALDTIPNGDFERWQGIGKALEKPQSWDTLGGISYPVTSVDYSKGTSIIQRPVYDGKTALSLACRTRGTLIYFGVTECKFKIKNRDPFLLMNMAYFEGNAPQFPIFEVIMWNSKTHDTITKEVEYLSSTTNGGTNWSNDTIEPWTTLSMPITFTYHSATDTTTPDSCHIYLQNGIGISGAGNPSASVLYIEKMWFANAAATAGINTTPLTENIVNVYPNPFTNKTTIRYNLRESGEVNLSVYDIQGKEVATLVNGNQNAGAYNQVFDGNGLSNGVYVYKLQTSSGVQTGKLILNR